MLAGFGLVAWAGPSPSVAPAAAQTDRLVAIGDVHGASGQFHALLQTLDLIDDEYRWSGGTATLVQTGDLTDRGAGVRPVLDLLMRLEREAEAAGGRVVVLLGNHETMNLTANLRDTSPPMLARFADEESEERRERAYEAYRAHVASRAEVLGPLAAEAQPRDAWMSAHPPGFLEYLDAMGPDGPYGRWLREKPVVTRLRDSVFLHGGLHPDGPDDLDDINRGVREELARYDRYRAQLVERGVILPFSTFQEIAAAVQRELQAWVVRIAPAGPPAPEPPAPLSRTDQEHVDMLLDMQGVLSWSIYDTDGPVWFRGFARWNAAEGENAITALADRYDADRFVVGHSPPESRLITPRFDARVVLIDTGMLTSRYAGRPSALEIVDDEMTAVYLDRRVPLAEAP